jgi:hypothetical protein
VEIPDAAVEKALDVLMDDGHNGIECRPDRGIVDSVRAALVAARPYLMPTRDEIAEVLTDCGGQRQIDEWPEDYHKRQADAVLALLNGES